MSVPICLKEQTFLWMSRIKFVGGNWKTFFVLCLFIVIITHAIISTHRRPQNLTLRRLCQSWKASYISHCPLQLFWQMMTLVSLEIYFDFGNQPLQQRKVGIPKLCSVQHTQLYMWPSPLSHDIVKMTLLYGRHVTKTSTVRCICLELEFWNDSSDAFNPKVAPGKVVH